MNKESLIDFDKYTITEDGNIFSNTWNKELHLSTNKKGYVVNTLICVNGEYKPFLRHRVIWYYFNGEIPENTEVNHIDECKTNNALSNLNLMTHKENTNWGTRNEKISKANKGRKFSKEAIEKRRLSKLNYPKFSKLVDQIDLETGEVIKEWPSLAEIERQLGYNKADIGHCCNGGYFDKRRNKWVNITQANGYGWKYL